jgi:hypothetical protein
MRRKRRNHLPAFKAKVAQEAVKSLMPTPIKLTIGGDKCWITPERYSAAPTINRRPMRHTSKTFMPKFVN